MFNTGACPTITAVLTVGHFVASGNSLTDSDLQLFIETEQDRTRHTFIQYYNNSIQFFDISVSPMSKHPQFA
jgi:hypothetical protein